MANPIRRSLSDFARRMRSLRVDHGVSAAKLSVLGRLLRADGPLTATDLAALERLQPQSLTRIIADLDELGFITRRQGERDRRQIEIEITAAGSELIRRDAHRQNLWLAQAMTERLTPAERAMLRLAAELLDRLAEQPAEPISES
ncbi:MarR family winged helix-turn-helix transcriptional regulator [Sphingomonas alpina]|uniref:MarR family transcriptional regulator n=1 Tax=Sphingomonas alpina TaxID=653931 RepID=A0A7H0LJX7_9SPHN|nr:MarR family transcriptional regulator [Sphingomonas alpina]QNQ09980.1 MarR family transcriptional regulator [Sphingomonas alpina]